MKTKEIVQPVKLIMEGASKLIIEIYESQKNIDFQKKYDDSPLTIADLRSNEFISTNLKKLFPDIPIISEEGWRKPKKKETFWLIDPLDGTKEFIDKSEEFTINIALVKKWKTFIWGNIYSQGKPLLLEVKISKFLVKKMAIKETCKHVFQKKTVELQLVRSIKLLKNKDLLDILKRSSKNRIFPAGSSL